MTQVPRLEVRAAPRNLLDIVLVHPAPKMKPLKIEPLVHRAALAGVALFPRQRQPDEIPGQYGQVFQLNGGPLKFSRSLASNLDSSNCDIPGTLPELP
jgi:hypothetical protein